MTLKALVEGIDFSNYKIIGNTDIEINKIEFDSRNIQAGDMFAAIKGTVADGHRFIESSIEKGAVCILCEDLPENYDNYDICIIQVESSRKELALLAESFYGFPSKKIKVVGITGTNGKTTISYLLRSVFDTLGKKNGIIGTTGIYFGNTSIPLSNTTPDPITLSKYFKQMLENGIEYVFMEVSSHSLHQYRTAGIAFDIGIFTNLTHDHLDYHPTIEDYADAKKILFQSLPKDGYAIYNYDDEFGAYMVENILVNKISVGRKDGADYQISEEEISPMSVKYKINGGSIEAPISGKFNIDNSALVLAAAKALGSETKSLVKAMKQIKGAPGRMERIDLKNGAIAYVDYAHTPDALEKALFTCRKILPKTKKLIGVVGCGGDRDATKRPIMGRLLARFSDIPIITSDNPRTENPNKIIMDMIDGIPLDAKDDVIIEADRRTAIAKACKIASEGDLILVAGKGHEDYQIIGTEKEHLSDAEELEKFNQSDN